MFRVIFIGGSDMNGNEQEVTTVSNQVHSASRMKVKKIAFIGLMGAVSAVLMLMRFPIPFMPPFLSFDLSGVMEIMCCRQCLFITERRQEKVLLSEWLSAAVR